MTPLRQIRADFDRGTIVVYQAYGPAIAEPALRAGRFVAPFSLTRMTWIKPSFPWLMARSSWARRPGQERILAVRIHRSGWDAALREGVLTSFEAGAHGDPEAWSAAFERAPIHVQWDPERSLRGAKLPHRSIQVGVSRHRIERFVSEWLVSLEDLTPRVHEMHRQLAAGRVDRARRLLPPERPYPVDDAVARRLGM
ncbi:MAG: DUF4291 domain-containing protein [Myxococcales bacterium]|nr:DUF4291 domain-containing protein [Myxococcales bacterium]